MEKKKLDPAMWPYDERSKIKDRDSNSPLSGLLPCPFCGGEAAIGSGENYYFVNCTECLASTNLLTAEQMQPGEDDARDDWNARAR